MKRMQTCEQNYGNTDSQRRLKLKNNSFLLSYEQNTPTTPANFIIITQLLTLK